MEFQNTLSFAKDLDSKDNLSNYRSQFHFPKINGKEVVYYTGNSLGLQPKTVKEHVLVELNDWADWGVEGHFHAKNPWFAYHEFLTDSSAKIVGAKPSEVVVMNGLTVNLHLLMVSFYQPKGKRRKILCESKAFPSDQYAIESQVRFHGLNPEEDIIEVFPRENEHTIRYEDVIKAIEDHSDEIALVLIGGVNYYTGQLFDMESITKAGHAAGAMVGFDLAHAAGNVNLQLHDWGVDFACWCSYKYLNSGPGNVSGAYVHSRHAADKSLPRFAGWWGYDKKTRFEMKPGFVPIEGAEGWQLSNAPVLGMAAHKASLEIFDEVGMTSLIQKSKLMTQYLEFIIEDISGKSTSTSFEIITPKNPNERGCQLSILAHGAGKNLFDKLTEEGVIADWREPNVIRIAPVPLYNSYVDAYNFGLALQKSVSS